MAKSIKIFQVIPFSGTIPSSKMTRIWRINLHDPLVDMGHEVQLSEANIDDFFVHAENDAWLKSNRPQLTDRLWQEFEIGHARRPFDLCFFYIADGFVEYEMLERIRQRGVPTLNFSCNNIHQFHLVRETSRHVDFAVYSERNAREKFLAIGARPIQMQMAANPSLYRPLPLPYEFDATFIGQRYADRGQYISAMVKLGINAHAFGARWKSTSERVGNRTLGDRVDKGLTIVRQNGLGYTVHYLQSMIVKGLNDRREDRILRGHVHEIVDDENMISLYSRSRINLGFNTVFQGARAGGKRSEHIRLRDFEIPMSGGFYLTGFTEELSEYFRIGEEIESYKSLDELLDKTKFYLANETARDRIRTAGRKRSLAEHRWHDRFQKLFSDIGVQ